MSEILLVDKWGDPIESRAVTNTSNSTAPASWLLNMNDGLNASGMPVTRETAMTVSAFYKACLLITGVVAKCATNVYSVDGANRTLNQKHPAYRLMRYKPNKYQRAYDLKQQMQLHLMLYGNAYAIIMLDERGRPSELLPLLPETVTMLNTPEGIFYQTSMWFDDGTTRSFTIDSSQMLHLTSMSYDGLLGYGLVKFARETLGQMLAMATHSGKFFKNGARPGGIMKHPGRLTREARELLREAHEAAYSGTQNAYKTLVLDEGMDFSLVGENAKNSQFVEQYAQCIREVANFFGLPPSKLGDSSRTAYNTLEQDALAALSDCYEGHLVNWEEALNEKLLSQKDQESGANVFAFDRSSLLAVDLKTRAEYIARALGNNTAWLTQDEGRSFFGLNPMGGSASELPPPNSAAAVGAQQGGMETEDPEDPADPEDDTTGDSARSAVLDVVREAIHRATTKGIGEISRAHKAGGVTAALQAVATARDGYDRIIGASVRALAAVGGVDPLAAQQGAAKRMSEALFTWISAHISEAPEEFQGNLQATGDAIALEIVQYADQITLGNSGKARNFCQSGAN